MAVFALPCISQAVEYRAELAAVWWQYEEQLDAGLASIDSSASGWSVQPRVQAAFGDPWIWNVGVAGLLPLQDADEQWVGFGFTQRNRLDVLQWEAEAALSRQWKQVELGIYATYRWHRQHRSGFVVNGVPVLLANEPVRELVQSTWVGARVEKRFMLSGKQALLQARVGLPAWARASNDLFGVLGNDGGYQFGVDAQWQLGARRGLDIGLKLGYHMSKLDGETRSDGVIWPENSWQTVSFAILGEW